MSQMLVVISCCIKFAMMRVLELQLATGPFQRFDGWKDWGDGLVVVVGEVKEDSSFDLQRLGGTWVKSGSIARISRISPYYFEGMMGLYGFL